MPNYRVSARAAAKKYGVPENVFLSLIKHESGWKPNAKSPAGAIGLTQLMPATARGLGVDPHNPFQNLDGGARYLAEQYKRFGSWQLALAAYNAGPGRVADGSWKNISETSSYVRNVLADAAFGKTGTTPNATLPNTAPPSIEFGEPDLSGLAFENLNQLVRGERPDPLASLSALTAAIASAPSSNPSFDFSSPYSTTPTAPTGMVTLAPGADRGGVKTGPGILSFAQRVAQVFGSPVKVTTGTNHNQFVAGTHRESDHWRGNAVDISATGATLTRLGRAALIAAGMDPKKAAKVKGGLFNINGHQIIFNASGPNVGGNHYNHLHISG